MLYIKHRFNSVIENIDDYDGVEVDVRWTGADFYTGHDKPERKISLEDLKGLKMWAHAKDVLTYKELCKIGVRCFMHYAEPVARVEGDFFWTCDPCNVCPKTVFMAVNGVAYTIEDIYLIGRAHAICTDNIFAWKEILK